MSKKWISIVFVLMLLLLGGCASHVEDTAATMQPTGTPSPTATPEPEKLDGSVFDAFIQASRDYNYYAIIPGIGDEAMLILTNAVAYCEANPPTYPQEGYYASDVMLYRYVDGAVQEVDFFHSMGGIMIDTEQRILYKSWGGQGVYQDIAVNYAEYSLEQWDDYYDSLDIVIDTDICSRNGESISKAEYDSLMAKREANRVALQVFPIERDILTVKPSLQQDSYVLVQPGDTVMRDGTIYLTFTEHYYEVFPAEQICKLEKGDVILFEGDPVSIERIEYEITEMDGKYAGKSHYYVNINQRYTLCSVSLETPELLYHVGENDGKFYQDGEIRTLPVQQGVAFRDYLLSRTYDDSGLVPVEVGYQDIPDYFNQQEIGVEIEIQNGIITSIWREWHP